VIYAIAVLIPTLAMVFRTVACAVDVIEPWRKQNALDDRSNIELPMAVWFTADHHFGHERVIELAGRPFTSGKEMDDELTWRWNAGNQRGGNEH